MGPGGIQCSANTPAPTPRPALTSRHPMCKAGLNSCGSSARKHLKASQQLERRQCSKACSKPSAAVRRPCCPWTPCRDRASAAWCGAARASCGSRPGVVHGTPQLQLRDIGWHISIRSCAQDTEPSAHGSLMDSDVTSPGAGEYVPPGLNGVPSAARMDGAGRMHQLLT